jgi:hypothetical protein
MAKELLQAEYHAKFMGWERSVKKDETTGEMVTTVSVPEFPGLEKVLETAQKMYDFVNQQKR